jgi:hypothetical protein
LADKSGRRRRHGVDFCILILGEGFQSTFDPRIQECSRQKPELRAALQDFSRLHDRITMANHPVLTTLVNLEFGLIVPPMALVSGILRGSLPIRDDKETIMVVLGARKLKSLHMQRAA